MNIRLIGVGIFTLLFSSLALGAQWRPAELVRSGTSRINGLMVDPVSLKLEVTNKRDKLYSFRLRGEYKGDSDVSLAWNNRLLKPAEDGSFEILVPVSDEVTPIQFINIDAYGRLEKMDYEIRFDDWEIFRAEVENDFVSVGTFVFGLGPTSISYTETGVQDYSSIVLTAKGGYSRPVFSQRWSAGISGFFTLVPLSESYAASARFLGFNIRLAYHLLKVPPPWKVSLQIGTYYTTMMVAGNTFGFENVTGPQLYPTVERTLKSGRKVRGYLKMSPLATNSSFLSFKSREFAGGVGYDFKIKGKTSYSAQFDYSDLLLYLPEQVITNKSISLGVTYGF